MSTKTEPKPQEDKIEFNLNRRQSEAWKALERDDIDTVMYGGAKGGGKSVFGNLWCFNQCLRFIQEYGLEPSQYPLPVGWMGRKQSVNFSDTTLETWKQFIPPHLYRIKEADNEIIVMDTVKLMYGGLDDRKAVNKFQSAEFCFIFVDQAEEISRSDYAMLKGTMRRKINDNQPKYKMLLTANPADNWIRQEFIENHKPKQLFVKALPIDNPFLATGYVETLREAFGHRPELVAAYVEGNWDMMSGHKLTIKPQWLNGCLDDTAHHAGDDRKLVSIDVARFGDDESVIYVFHGPRVVEKRILLQQDTMVVASEAVSLMRRHGCRMIICDGIGVGGGVVDRCRELGAQVFDFQAAAKATESIVKNMKFKNVRSQMWWEAGYMMSRREVVVPNDKQLIEQLTGLEYEFTLNNMIQVESKQDYKKRTSMKSPDRADAYVQGLYGLRFVPTEQSIESHRQKRGVTKWFKDSKRGYGWNDVYHRQGVA